MSCCGSVILGGGGNGGSPGPDNELTVLCDATGAQFLRRYTIAAAGTVTYTDTELDGTTAFTPAEPAGSCAADGGPPCDQTTPLSAVGLCLADGAPIAVTAERDCAGVVTQTGWLNLTTGAWSTGAPPAGTGACSGEASQFTLVGLACDVDPATGAVNALVIIQYQRAADGSITGVTLIDAATGDPYTLAGELSVCPSGTSSPERDLVALCDAQIDGTVVAFIRDYQRDQAGAVTGFTDYDLAGDPYTPTGQVLLCEIALADQAEESPGDLGLVVPQESLVPLCDTLPDGTVVSFVRDYQRDATGAIVDHADYDLAGATYTPTGVVGVCSTACGHSHTLTLCDSAGDPTTADLAATNTDPLPYPTAPAGENLPLDADAAKTLWGGGAATFGPDTGPSGTQRGRSAVGILGAACLPCHGDEVTLTASVHIHLNGPDPMCVSGGGLVLFNGTTSLGSSAPPANAPVGYDGILTVTETVTVADLLAGNLALAVTLETWQDNVACDDTTKSWTVDSFTATIEIPTAPGCGNTFLRTIRIDCDGDVIGVENIDLAGAPYTPVGDAAPCKNASTEPCCDPCAGSEAAVDCDATQVCVRPSGHVEFISNAGNVADDSVDPDWEWSTSLTGPWFPMYRAAPNPGWTTQDPGTADGTAHWVVPHPGAGLLNTGRPGEGPDIPCCPGEWYARASFLIPLNADPSTIKIGATVLNADQVAVEFRLNGGAWQPLNASFVDPPFTLAPTAIPGAQAGMNEVIVHARETVPSGPGSSAGILLHATADFVSVLASWTRVVCSDDSLYYVDESGTRQDALPDGWALVPCGSGGSGSDGCPKQILERCGCDDADGDGEGEIEYTELWAIDPCGTDPPQSLGAYRDGDFTQPITVTNPVDCPGEGA